MNFGLDGVADRVRRHEERKNQNGAESDKNDSDDGKCETFDAYRRGHKGFLALLPVQALHDWSASTRSLSNALCKRSVTLSWPRICLVLL